MSRYGCVLDLPLPQMRIGAGDIDAIDWQLKDRNGPLDLTGLVVELRLRPLRGSQTVLSFKTTDASPKLVVTTPATGWVKFTPAADTFSAAADQYRGHFLVGSGQRVPQEDDFFLDIFQAD